MRANIATFPPPYSTFLCPGGRIVPILGELEGGGAARDEDAVVLQPGPAQRELVRPSGQGDVVHVDRELSLEVLDQIGALLRVVLLPRLEDRVRDAFDWLV